MILKDRKNFTAALKLLPASCSQFLEDNQKAISLAAGSGKAHQAWQGGYLDHLDEVFAVAKVFYTGLSALRPLSFSLEDALLVLFLHDVEKIWKHLPTQITTINTKYRQLAQDQKALQKQIVADYQIELTEEQENALKYVHGELDDYVKGQRIMGPLAVFVHDCDYWSARGWYNEPVESGPLPNVFDRLVQPWA